MARAIASEPEILLADEPTGSLDSESGEKVLSVMEEMNRSGVTVIMITHDNRLSERAKRCIRIVNGQIMP